MTASDPGDTVAILGLGLMGGSLAWDLAAAGTRVLAADPDRSALDAARETGVISGTFQLDEEEYRVRQALADASILVLATPVSAAVGLLDRVAGLASPDAVITDLGSTKRSILAAARAAGLENRFVGSHPMTGDTLSGWPAARPGLFRAATVWLCPTDRPRNGPGVGPGEPHDRSPEGTESDSAVDRVAVLWRRVGAEPRITDGATHDREVAWSSHLPQVVASALGRTLATVGVPRGRLGPGGLDTTRLARSEPGLWSDILSDNADMVTPALDALLAELTRVRGAVAGRDTVALAEMLAAARRWSDA